jgi:hypothetical protein
MMAEQHNVVAVKSSDTHNDSKIVAFARYYFFTITCSYLIYDLFSHARSSIKIYFT